ncbi:MAG: secreted protein [Bacteroidota bacterium]|nr:secreted protein [Bacteroidota bacterium]
MKTILLLLLSFSVTATDISMMGIKINSTADVKNLVAGKLIKSDNNVSKYKTADGNYFSVTSEDGVVKYMENDWTPGNTANTPLITDFKFGETTLEDIRKTFGTIGYSYRNRSYLKSETDLTTITCFEIDSPGSEILVVIAKAPIKDIAKDEVPKSLKLEAVILADKKYLDELWGKKKTFDPQYKKIKL